MNLNIFVPATKNVAIKKVKHKHLYHPPQISGCVLLYIKTRDKLSICILEFPILLKDEGICPKQTY